MVKSAKNKLQLKRLRAAQLLKASSPCVANAVAAQSASSQRLIPKPILSASHRRPPPPMVIPVSRLRKRTDASGTISNVATAQAPRLHVSHSRGKITAAVAWPRWLQRGQQKVRARTSTSSRRRRLKGIPERVDRNYGSIKQLQQILGLDENEPPEFGVTLVALDLEWTESMAPSITEIGVTTLKVRDVMNLEPGPFVTQWKNKMEHTHIVTSASSKPAALIGSSLFGRSTYMTASQANARLQAILGSLVRPNSSDRVVLVGQSITVDISVLQRDPAFGLSLERVIGPNFQVFDTFRLGSKARSKGHAFPDLSLASIAVSVGIEKRYHSGLGLIACHNASNDAAYTLITLLIFALRWKDLSGRGTVSRQRAQQAWERTGLVVGGFSEGPVQPPMASERMRRQLQAAQKVRCATRVPGMRNGAKRIRLLARLRRKANMRQVSWTQWLWQSIRTLFKKKLDS